MTNEEIRIAVAEELGWSHVNPPSRIRLLMNPPNSAVECFPPNYPTSLDACAEFEKTLSEKEVVFYLIKLLQVRYKTGADHGMIACMQDKLTFATAIQRCEAFLRLRGKWKEDGK